MTHAHIPTQPNPQPRPQVADPELLARAVTKVGSDFPSVGAVLYAGRVGAA